jgi:hypothetical protein
MIKQQGCKGRMILIKKAGANVDSAGFRSQRQKLLY